MLSECENIRTSSDVTMSVKELYDLVYIQKRSDRQIARMKGLTSKTIRNWRRKLQFNSTFKTGVMDLPISEVKTLIESGRTDTEIVQIFNTTMTSYLAFKRRYGLGSEEKWPIDRRHMLELVLQELTDVEIGERCGRPTQDVTKLRNQYELKENTGKKMWENYGHSPRAKDDGADRPDLISFAHAKLGIRFRTDFSGGFTLDGRPVLLDEVMKAVGFV